MRNKYKKIFGGNLNSKFFFPLQIDESFGDKEYKEPLLTKIRLYVYTNYA